MEQERDSAYASRMFALGYRRNAKIQQPRLTLAQARPTSFFFTPYFNNFVNIDTFVPPLTMGFVFLPLLRKYSEEMVVLR